MEEVKAAEEGDPSSESDGNFIFEGSLLGFDCWIFYWFPDNRLEAGQYVFHDDKLDERLAVSCFGALKELLVKKYGDPAEADLDVEQPFSSAKGSEWLSMEDALQLCRYVIWLTDNTVIRLLLYGICDDPSLFISYASPEFVMQTKVRNEAKVLEQL